MAKLKTVSVSFVNEDGWRNSARRYEYVTDLDAKVGDTAVVLVANVLKLTKIESIQEGVSEKATKVVVGIIDLEGYEERCKNVRELKAIRDQLKSRVKEIEQQRTFEDILGNDEVGKELLARLKELEG